MQITLKPGIITTRAELIAQVPEKSRGKAEKIGTTETVVKRHDLVDMTVYRFEEFGTFDVRATRSAERCLEGFQVAGLLVASLGLADQQGELSLDPIGCALERGVEKVLDRRPGDDVRMPAPVGHRADRYGQVLRE